MGNPAAAARRPTTRGNKMLTKDQKRHYEESGYVRVERVIDPGRYLDPIIREYEVLLDRLAKQLRAEGKIESDHAGLGFRKRMTKLYAETGQTFAQYFNMSLPTVGTTEGTPFWTGPAIFELIRNPALLDLLEDIIGPEIASNPIQHVRIKPPERFIPESMKANGLVGATPWHQDASVVPPGAETEMVTAWIPINDAPVQSGCLQFLPNVHRTGLFHHGFGPVDGLEIHDTSVSFDDAVAVPARRGDVLLIHRTCPHSSLPNRSDQVRFSLDLRFHPAHQSSGREVLPSFIARSRLDPGRELRDADAWNQMWMDARHWLATSPDAPSESYEWIH